MSRGCFPEGALITRTASRRATQRYRWPGPLCRDGSQAAQVWGLTYGMGFQLLDQSRVDGGFGQRIAIRTADRTT